MTWLRAALRKTLEKPFSRLQICFVFLWPLCAWSGPHIELAWDSSLDTDVAGYKVYFGTSSGNYSSQIDAGNANSISLTLPDYDTTYYLAATTYNTDGLESDFSNEAICQIAATTVSNPPPVVYTAPTLSTIGNISLWENAGTQTVALSGISAGSGSTLAVTASSSNPSLIPNPAVTYTSPNSTGSLTFTPVAYANGSAIVMVTLNNGQHTNNLTTQSFTVNVAAVNQAPTLNALSNLDIAFSSSSQTVSLSGISPGANNENQTLTITANSSNPTLIPNPTISYTSPNTTGLLVFKPLLNTNGSATITVTVNDGGNSNNIVTKSFLVNVAAVYNAPTLSAISDVSVAENAGTKTVALSGISAGSGSTVTVTAVSSNPALIPTPSVSYTTPNTTGSLSFTPAAYASGSATITVTANNGQPSNNIATQSFTVFVAAVNQSPTLNTLNNLALNYSAGAQTVSLSGISAGATNESQTLKVTATSSNPALIPNPTVSYTSPNSTGSLTLTPALNTNGSAIISVSVNDGGTSNNIVTKTFTVTVTAVYAAPTLDVLNDLKLAYNSSARLVNLSGISSGSGAALTVTAVSSNPTLIPSPSVSYTSPNTVGSLTVKPTANTSGSALITVTVKDGATAANACTRTFTVMVSGLSQSPSLATIDDVAIEENAGTQSIELSGISGGSGSTVTVTAVSSNPALIPDPSVSYTNPNTTGSLSFTPAACASGSATISVTVNNGELTNNVVTRSFIVNVAAVNQKPTLNELNNLELSNSSPTQTINLSGISSGAADEFQPLTVKAVSSNAKLIPTPTIKYSSPLTTGTLTFKPAPNASGLTTITVTVNDGGTSNNIITRSFTVTVNPKGTTLSAPKLTAQPKSQVVLAGKSAKFQVKASGTGRLKYQWKYNGTNIAKATKPSLNLSKCSTKEAGVYSVTVSDDSGSISSAPAALVVSPTPAATLSATVRSNNNFSFDVIGVAGYSYAVQASTDMIHWTSIQTNNSPFTFVDTNADKAERQFYRTVCLTP